MKIEASLSLLSFSRTLLFRDIWTAVKVSFGQKG
jgi:hypothetical protein